MSVTYEFVCDDCKKKCSAGQGSIIYKYKYIAKFLIDDHLGHNLRVIYEENDEEKLVDYEDVSDYDE